MILGSGIALLDGTVVNIAVRSIGTDLQAGLGALQWVVNGYMLSLAALILVGGAAGDRFGRRRMYAVGVAGFGLASLLCAFAQTAGQLIAFRVVQGVFAALLTPGSLAIIQASFARRDRPAAIGTWAGVSGIATAIGPFVGGFLLDVASWRWIFAINVPLCAVVLFLARGVPESRDEESGGRFDVPGAVAAVATLGLLTHLLTAWRGMQAGTVALLAALVLACGAAFLVLQRRPGALMPLELWRSRVFSAANVMTLLVYGALGALMFLLVLQLQVSAGYSPLAAGLATLPVTIALLLLSSRFATLASRTGPRVPMTVGPLVCMVGVVLLSFVDGGASYWVEVLPGMVVFALGLATLVSPLTSAVLAAAPDRHAGIASGINNAVARSGTLLAVAALPAIVGLTGREYRDPVLLTAGYQEALLICAGLLGAGGMVSWFGLSGTTGQTDAQEAP